MPLNSTLWNVYTVIEGEDGIASPLIKYLNVGNSSDPAIDTFVLTLKLYFVLYYKIECRIIS